MITDYKVFLAVYDRQLYANGKVMFVSTIGNLLSASFLGVEINFALLKDGCISLSSQYIYQEEPQYGVGKRPTSNQHDFRYRYIVDISSPTSDLHGW